MGVEEWLARGRREMRPLLVKVGVAVSLSLACYLYSHLSSRAARRPRRGPSSGGESRREASCGGLKDELLHLQCEDAPSSFININGTNTRVSSVIVGFSPSCKSTGDEEGYFLSQLNELVLPEVEPVGMGTETPETLLMKRLPEKKEEQEVATLKSLVESLQERERSMEIELLEYYGLKEQESTVQELENRLRISAMETELLSVKMESLKSENQRLEAQASDCSNLKAELEEARTKIKHLKRKVKLESAQAKEKMATLHQKAAALQDLERRWEEEEEEAERRLKRTSDLEKEAEELRKVNSRLALVNSDLARKVESAQILDSSGLESPEATKSKEESNRLRHRNEELTKEIEQLQTDRCADVEELVYLRWVNACLRYELRNYQPPPGKTMARDLSRTLSPKSEHKVKQLILEYAKSGGIDGKSINLTDFDSENGSSSQASSGDPDDAMSAEASPATKKSRPSKAKFLTKLKRLVLGKDIRVSSVDRSPMSGGNSGRRASVSSGCSFEEVVGRLSCDGAASCIALDRVQEHQLKVAGAELAHHEQQQRRHGSPWTQNLSRVSLDFHRLRSHEEHEERCKGDVEASWQTRMFMGEEILVGSPRGAGADKKAMDALGKLEKEKHARASKSPRRKPMLRVKSANFAFG